MNLEVEPRHDPCGGRRERRRQIDADEGARRRRPAGQRHDPARRRAGRRSIARRRPQARHRHRLPGAQPFPRALGARQPLRQPRAGPLRHRLDAGDGGTTAATCSTGSASMSTSTRRSAGSASASGSSSSSARVLLEEPRLLILDEPNSALNERETERLFAVLRSLSAARHHHALRVAPAGGGLRDLRPGHRHPQRPRRADQPTSADLTIPEVIEGMIGVQPGGAVPAAAAAARRAARGGRSSSRASAAASSRDVDFTARAGEVVGLAGLEGSGVADLLAMLFGTRARPRRRGRAFPTAAACRSSPTDAARRGVCLVPADRRRNGLMLDKSILFNISQVVFGAQRRRRSPGTASACACAARRPDRRAPHQDALAVGARQPAFRRQPAEGRHRQVAGDRAAGVPARRPDPRRRRRRQARDLRPHPRDVGRRRHRAVQLDRAARADRPLRPHPGPLPRPARRRADGRRDRQPRRSCT